jgi:hypothetical protein
MEIDIRKIILNHFKPRAGFSHEHQLVVFVSGDMPLFRVNEFSKLSRIL